MSFHKNTLIILIFLITGCEGFNSLPLKNSGDKKALVTATPSPQSIENGLKKNIEPSLTPNQSSDIPKVKSVEMSQKNVTIEINKNITLSANVNIESGGQNSAVEWISSDASIVSVNSSGLISALKKGTAIVKAISLQDNQVFDSCVVTVTDTESDYPTSVEIRSLSGNKNVFQGTILSLSAIVKYAGGKSDSDVIWKSSDESVAPVATDGVVTGLRTGSVTITAISSKNNSISSVFEITVIPKPIPSPTPTPVLVISQPFIPPVITVVNVKITPPSNTVIKSTDTLTLTSAVTMSNESTNSNITWTSSDNSVATVDSAGKVTGVKAGTVKITAVSSIDLTTKDTVNLTIVPAEIPEMILIQGGTFQMGNPGYATPVHTVTLSSFYLGKYEITQKQYKAITGTNPSYFKNWLDDNFPVEDVTWFDAIKYCNGLSISQGLPVSYKENTGELLDSSGNVTTDITKVKGYRLPTEAEWEFAAKGGSNFPDYEFSGSDRPDYAGWYKSNAAEKIHNVGLKQPNGLGIFDMTGNVSEWVTDWYTNYSVSTQVNPYFSTGGSNRLQRGGSWFDNSSLLMDSGRNPVTPNLFDRYSGFRVCRSSGSPPPSTVTSNAIVKITAPSDFSLKTGNILQLNATVTGGSNLDLTWLSSDSSVATVDSTGKVTGIKEGSVKITVFYKTDSSKSDSVSLSIMPSSPATMNAANQFSIKSNPNGVWSYGYSLTKGSPFILFKNYRLNNLVFDWVDEKAPFCFVLYNPFEKTVYPADVIIAEPQKLVSHPGTKGEYSIIRWTAQETGKYSIDSVFTGKSGYNGTPPATTEVVVLKGANQLFGSNINLNGNGNQKSFHTEINLLKGESIDFAVGYGNNDYNNDSTGVDIVIQKL